MSSRKKKAQISVYIDPDIMTMLADYAARREQSQSMIAEAAIASFLSPDDAERREAAIAKRLDQLDRRMTRLERDIGISVETLQSSSGSGSRRHRLCRSRLHRPRVRKPASAMRRSLPLSAGASPKGRSSGRRFPRMSAVQAVNNAER
jgi:predicted transcriptional regulator